MIRSDFDRALVRSVFLGSIAALVGFLGGLLRGHLKSHDELADEAVFVALTGFLYEYWLKPRSTARIERRRARSRPEGTR